MVTETDGIILRQTKTAADRRVLVLLTRKFGKVSAGTGISQYSRKKSSLPLRAFTHGRYELYHGRTMFNIDAADTIESFYEIGENVDSFFAASYALEFTDKVLTENIPAEHVLDTLLGLMRILSGRKKKLRSLLLMYQWKLLDILGYMPRLDSCARCGRKGDAAGLSVVDGGIICSDCKKSGQVNLRLLYDIKFGIIQILDFIGKNEIDAFADLALSRDAADYLSTVLRSYISYHLDIGEMKSGSYLSSDD